jgi:hypothetical protein
MQFVLCVESKKTADGVLNLSDLIKAFTHDIMGDVTFGPANRLVRIKTAPIHATPVVTSSYMCK